jgi:outer membrane protein OmpA-like peptidoglycan-associated protein
MTIISTTMMLAPTHIARRTAAAGAAITTLLASGPAICQSTTQFAEKDAPLFVKPQDPQKLANLLYPKVRSLSAAKSEPDAAQPRFSMAILFAYDSATLRSASLPMLDSIGQMLNLPKVINEGLVIEGHTDARGSKRYNKKLGLRRANAIKQYLAGNHNIHPVRLLTVSYGETRLRRPQDPTASHNRRAAFRPMRLEDLR